MENDQCFKELLDLIHATLGLDCREYNESYIMRRVNGRILSNGLQQNDFAAYVQLLKVRPGEIRQLYDALTVNVTQFFRDISLWETLAGDVLPRVIDEKLRRSERNLRVWSCGCASGEEPYSLAILLREATAGRGIVPHVTATDIDDVSLQKATVGVYDPVALKSMPGERVSRYFRQTTAKGGLKYEVDPSLKTVVQFVRHNFLRDLPPGNNFDMIFCRNVIIYFNAVAKDNLMNTFYDSLVAHGWLVLGKSEVLFTLKSHQNFYLYNSEERVYRKERRKVQAGVERERRKNWWYGYGKPAR